MSRSTTAPGPSPSEAVARTVEVDTPEQVVLAFELADLGSRFLALVLDGLLLTLVLAGLAGSLLWLRFVVRVEVLASLGTAALVLLTFAVAWGYFFYFEAFRGGRTPGKAKVGLRVVHDGGYPLTVRGAAIRNLIRLIDVQPFFSCLVGGVAMMIHPRTKRLGDLAAATLVVRDRGAGTLPEEGMIQDDQVGRPRLSDEQFVALDRFVARSATLDDAARDRLALRLGDALADPLASELAPGAPAAPLIERLETLHAGEARRRRAFGGDERGSRQAARLLRSNRERWDEYEALVAAARKGGLAALPEADVSRFATLYRLVAADLARVRSYGGSGELAYALERLVAEGHNLFYRPGEASWTRLRDWLVRGFPALVRRHGILVAAAAAALFAPAIVTYGVVRADPASARMLLPPAMVERAELAPARLARGEAYIDPPGVLMPVMSSSLIANNVRVTLLVFAGGVLAGAGSLFILVLNGVHLGAVVGLYDVNDASVLLWTFVAPHGVLELTAICIAGAAGLWMGSALVLPGRLTRRDALASRAREAVSLLAGTTLLLILAGLIEGFVSPAAIPPAAKLVVAALVGSTGLVYLLWAGREPRPARGAADVPVPHIPPEGPYTTPPDLTGARGT